VVLNAGALSAELTWSKYGWETMLQVHVLSTALLALLLLPLLEAARTEDFTPVLEIVSSTGHWLVPRPVGLLPGTREAETPLEVYNQRRTGTLPFSQYSYSKLFLMVSGRASQMSDASLMIHFWAHEIGQKTYERSMSGEAQEPILLTSTFSPVRSSWLAKRRPSTGTRPARRLLCSCVPRSRLVRHSQGLLPRSCPTQGFLGIYLCPKYRGRCADVYLGSDSRQGRTWAILDIGCHSSVSEFFLDCD
jgi:hypothetical protein